MTQVQEFYRRDVDGLRAIAILAVVAFHAGVPGVPGGFVGVDVFFVISGYLITSLLIAEVARDGRASLRSFYARRIRRLFPALFVVIGATLAAGIWLLLPNLDQQQDLARSTIATSLYVSNYYFWLNSPGYFDSAVELKPLLHTWSLAVEEQFYLIWPAVVAGVLAWSGRGRGRFERSLLGLVVLTLVVSLAWCVYSTRTSPEAAFYLLPSRAWELATGSALAIVLPRIGTRPGRLGGGLAVVGIAAIIVAVLTVTDEMEFPGVLACLPVFGTALVLIGGHIATTNPVTRVLATSPMVHVGLLSYSWYLWHWPVLALVRAYSMEEADLWRAVALAAGSLLSAYLSYRYMECPVRFRRPGPFRRTETTLATGVAISVAACLLAGALGLWARHTGSNLPGYARLMTAIDDRPPMRQRCHQNPPFDGLAARESCVAGTASRPIGLVLWGDSHADHLSPLMQAFAAELPGTGVLARSFSGCTPLAPLFGMEVRDYPDCRAFDAAVYREIVDLRKEGLLGVILAARWLRVSDSAVAGPSARQVGAIEGTVRALTDLGLRVVVVAPIPTLPYSAPLCIARSGAAACRIPRVEVERQRARLMATLYDLQDHSGKVRVFDPIETLCDSRYCYVERDRRILFLDDRHLTATASRLLLPDARSILAWAARGSP